MTPTFESRAACTVVGCGGEFTPADSQAISSLWGEFAPRIGEIAHRKGLATFGVCCPMTEEQAARNKFTYVAAVEVSEAGTLPEGMMSVDMPAAEYAVFAHETGIGPQIGETMQAVFGDWLPNSEFEQCGIDFEYYDERFNPMTGEGTFFIYVPVVRKR